MIPCGPHLWSCRCNGYRAALRTQDEVNALHAEAVERARRSGFAGTPVPEYVLAVLLPDMGWYSQRAA